MSGGNTIPIDISWFNLIILYTVVRGKYHSYRYFRDNDRKGLGHFLEQASTRARQGENVFYPKYTILFCHHPPPPNPFYFLQSLRCLRCSYLFPCGQQNLKHVCKQNKINLEILKIKHIYANILATPFNRILFCAHLCCFQDML